MSVPALSLSDPAAPAGHRFTFAFQPIIDAVDRQVYSYEALVRGPGGESAATVFQQIAPADLHDFDRRARVLAIAQAARLRVPCRLNLNFLPQSLQTSPDAITSIFEAAVAYQFPVERIVLEVTESEVIDDAVQLGRALNAFRAQGLTISIDDFGAGYAGLNFLCAPSCRRVLTLASTSSPRALKLRRNINGFSKPTSDTFRAISLRSPVLSASRVCAMSEALDNGDAPAKYADISTLPDTNSVH